MSAGRYVAVAGLALAVVLLAAQTGAFSAIAADRDVQVTVVDDQSAYLGVETDPVSVPGNTTTSATLATVTNRFGSSIDVSVTVTEGSDSYPTLTGVTGPGTLSSGESAPVVADVTCDDDANGERVDIGVEATGPDFGIQLTRSVEVTCERVVVTETTETDVVATETGSETASG